MIHLLGDDPDGDEILAGLSASLGEAELRDLNTTVFEGQKIAYEDFCAACEAMPFLAAKRLVVVRGLLTRLEPKSGPQAGANRKNDGADGRKPSELVRQLGDYLPRLPYSVELAFVESVSITRQNPLYQPLSRAGARFMQSGELRPGELAAWIERRVAAKSGRLAAGTANLVANYYAGNLRTLDAELDKLVAYAGQEAIDRTAVERLLTAVQEQNVYRMCDALAEGNAAVALQHLHSLIDGGGSPLYLLAMVIRQFRLLVQVKELRSQGERTAVVANRLRTKDFVVEKLERQLRRFPTFERLEDIYRRLVQADEAGKSGGRELELNLELLIAELATPRRAVAALRG